MTTIYMPSYDSKEELSEEEMLNCIASFVASCKTQREAAKIIGISATHLNQILAGAQAVSPSVAARFGRNVGRTYIKA